MALEDFEYMAGQKVYEVYNQEITLQGSPIGVKYLGAISLERAKELTSGLPSHKGLLGNSEYRCEYPLNLGELEQKVGVGMLIVGEPQKGNDKVWLSPVIDTIC